MYDSLHSSVGISRLTRCIGRVLSAGAISLTLVGAAYAATIPANLGNGLDKVVQAKSKVAAYQNAAANDQGSAMYDLAITDAQGRVLVRINPMGDGKGSAKIGVRTLASTLTSTLSSVEVTSIDDNYRNIGVMNAWVSVDDVPALASQDGVRSVILELKPRLSQSAGGSTSAVNGDALVKLGTTFDQGVTQHRVDQINKFYNTAAPVDYEGTGMSVGFISNSYAAQQTTAGTTDASVDVTNFDLPGSPSNPVNTQPVVVIQDDLTSTASDDEGRGMIQIGYKMAPKAKLAFATADFGEVGFANNIRALAGISTDIHPTPLFAADAICDDVGYFDEPYFQDGIIGAGVDDAAAAGVSYFSSAANDIGTNGYDSEIRLVPNGTGLTAAAGNAALINTNINLAGVPANLYAGGFHNFNPIPGQIDVAQTVNVAANNTVVTILQWNDPYDQNGGFKPTGQIYSNTGTFTTTAVVFDQTSSPPLPQFLAGQAYSLVEQATSGTYDAVITIINPDGTTLLTQDTGIDETVNFTAPTSGQYKISFGHFSTTTGNFQFTISTATTSQLVISDWNLLAFRTDTGAYVPASSLTTDNIASNEPVEIGYVNRTSATVLSIQYVLARANTPPAGARVADHIRYLIPGNGRAGYGPAEYFNYNTVTTGGHAMAQGSNGMAAYSVFRSSLPETFTSPGPVSIYFDADGNALPLPEIRRQPRLAAADGANVSSIMNPYFASDSTSDPDSNGNFFGTSAAGPHAAAIAALVLEAHGGPRSLTPTQMTTLLETTTFRHDLDPAYSGGTARTSDGDSVRVSVFSDGSALAASSAVNYGTGGYDANSFSVTYTGGGSLTSLTFNPEGTALTGGNVSGGVNGYQDGTAPAISYFELNYPGMVFAPSTRAFTVGSLSSIPASSVTATYAHAAPLPAPATTSWTMSLAFDSSFTSGKTLRFNVARAVQHSSVVTGGTGPTNGGAALAFLGDLLGGGVSLPSGAVNLDGMTFSGTTSTGGTFSGVIRNRVQRGYSPVDGYGFINAQSAVGAPAP
jgi:hypothetical protein